MKHEKPKDWNHAQCAGCWNRRHPDEEPIAPTETMRGKAATPAEVCCFCGATAGGIYVRHDPASNELRCAP